MCMAKDKGEKYSIETLPEKIESFFKEILRINLPEIYPELTNLIVSELLRNYRHGYSGSGRRVIFGYRTPKMKNMKRKLENLKLKGRKPDIDIEVDIGNNIPKQKEEGLILEENETEWEDL